MAETGFSRVWVSPTAMHRFRERVDASLSDDEIIALLNDACRNPVSMKRSVRDDGQPAVTVRVKHQVYRQRIYEYRCVVVPPESPDGFPVVATTLQGSWRQQR